MKERNREDSDRKQNNCSSMYECTICIENAKEPVVTKCGHIFCWPCLYSVHFLIFNIIII